MTPFSLCIITSRSAGRWLATRYAIWSRVHFTDTKFCAEESNQAGPTTPSGVPLSVAIFGTGFGGMAGGVKAGSVT